MKHEYNNMILGLDLGTTSIGWCLIEGDPAPKKILGAGVRIFPEGMDRTKGEKSLNQDRRVARSLRRQTYRRARRKLKLKNRLIQLGFLPKDEGEFDSLIRSTDPYELRSRATTEKLTDHELGRALYHLGQRRGYKSNRKTGDEKDGAVAKGITEIQQAIESGGFPTLGAYLYSLNPHQQRIRNRYTARTMYEREFDAIWTAQEPFHPQSMDVNAKIQIQDALFHQRPLKIQRHLIGECEFEPGRKRAPRASLAAQEFRLWDNINKLRILHGDGSERPLTDKERLLIHSKLRERKDMKWEKLRELMDLYEGDRFNLEQVRKSGLLGNQTAAMAATATGKKEWKALGEKDQERLVHDMLYLEDEALTKRLRRYWKFDSTTIEKLFKCSMGLPKGYMHLSQKALREITYHLRSVTTENNQGLSYDKACELAGYDFQKKVQQRNSALLPFPGTPNKTQGQHIQSEVKIGDLRNPMVIRALFQLRRVVNSIIRTYGKPDVIRIELARDLKNNAKQRDEIKKRNYLNAQLNEKAKQFLIELGLPNPSRTDKLKYRLWEECKHVCPFSGKTITPHSLFLEPEFEIEHITPYSRSLDDSFMNKTLCHRVWNHRKGNQTPWEAFHADESEYAAMLQRAKGLPYPKFKRFAAQASKADFVSQQLNETRYIAVKAAEYLQQLGCKVKPVKGGTTATLRRAWQLDGLLSSTGVKSRADHRHHAVDALVVALTTESTIKRISDHAVRSYDGRIRIENYPEPMANLREMAESAIQAITVSHKPLRKVKGALHEATLYGFYGEIDEKGNKLATVRKPLAMLTQPRHLEDIRDPTIQRLALEHLDSHGGNMKKAFGKTPTDFGFRSEQGELKQPIKRVVLQFPLNVERIAEGKRQRHVKTGSNHHIEIVETKSQQGVAKWEGKVVTTLQAVARKAANLPVVETNHGENRRFVMALMINDMVEFDHNGNRGIFYVQKMDQSGRMIFRAHNDASDKADRTFQISKQPSSLKAANPVKLEVDVLGKITRIVVDEQANN